MCCLSENSGDCLQFDTLYTFDTLYMLHWLSINSTATLMHIATKPRFSLGIIAKYCEKKLTAALLPEEILCGRLGTSR